jgi:hypothetical protein
MNPQRFEYKVMYADFRGRVEAIHLARQRGLL